MATTLRELIAKVVFRVDASKLVDFDAKVDHLKTTLIGVDAQTRKVVRPMFDAGPLQSFVAKLKAAGAELRGLPGRAAAAFGKFGGSPGSPAAPAPPAAPKPGGAAGGLDGIGKLLGGLGAAATAYKAIGWGQQLVSEAKQVADLSAALGMATDEFQTWSAFAGRVGASNEDLGGTIKALANNMRAAAETADGPAAKAFQKLGLSTEGWSEKLPDTTEVLLAAGGAISSLEGDTERLALAQQLLGEAGLKLLPGFKGGTEAAKEQLAQLRELAVVYDSEFIEKSKEVSKEMDLFERQLKGVGVEILGDVLPALRDLVRWLAPVIKGVRSAIRDSNALTAALGVAGATGVLKLVGNLGKLVNILKTGRSILLRFVLPFLLLDDVISLLKGEESVIGDLLDAMFGAGAAAEVVEGLHAAWEGVVGAAKSLWDTLGVVLDMLFDVGDEGENAAARTESAFMKASEGIGKAFDGLFDGLKSYWDQMVELNEEMGPKTLAEAAAIETGEIAPRKLGENRDPRYQKGGEFYGEGGAGISTLVERSRAWSAKTFPMSADIAKRNAENALALGGSPAVGRGGSTTVTVNDNSTVTSNINGVDAQNIGPALRQTERNIASELKRNKAQVLRQTVGAAGT